MTVLRPSFVVLCAALACAGTASAGVRLEAREQAVPPAPSARGEAQTRVLAARTAPLRFNLVGIQWRGPGRVAFRTARADGGWSAWRPARSEGEDRPDAGTAEGRTRTGWTLGDPVWTGAARRIQYRVSGRVTRLRTSFLWSPVTAAAPLARTIATATKPAIVTRSGWKANERIVRAKPSYASRTAFTVVHHTAGSAPTSASQSAAIVRAIQTYHVRSNGWNDIGYNFLVDPFGQIFEGRGGGVARSVIGAHAQGFNTGSVGIAVLGSYGSKAPSAAAKAALARLIAWRLDLARVDPTSTLTWKSLGSSKYPAGTSVAVSAVTGHGNLGLTACPGAKLKGALRSIAQAALARGGPKLFNPAATGKVGGPIHFVGRLSAPLAWTVRVLDAAGIEVASGGGTGTLVDWTWNSGSAPPGVYSYVIGAKGVRSATGRIPGEPPLTFASFAPTPAVLRLNADSTARTVTMKFTASKNATLALRLEMPEGAPVATILAARALAAGKTATFAWRGRSGGAPVPDGRYVVVAEATAGAEHVKRAAPLTIDRTIEGLTVAPAAFSPNGDGRRETVAVGFILARAATVRLRVVAGKTTVATLLGGAATSGLHSVTWTGDGATQDGTLRVVLQATTSLGTRKVERPLVRDTKKPRVTVLAASRRPNGGTLVRLRLDEPALLRLRFDGETIKREREAGVWVFRRRLASDAVSVYAQDAAANGRTVWARVG